MERVASNESSLFLKGTKVSTQTFKIFIMIIRTERISKRN
jgi:hypothetical protein